MGGWSLLQVNEGPQDPPSLLRVRWGPTRAGLLGRRQQRSPHKWEVFFERKAQKAVMRGRCGRGRCWGLHALLRSAYGFNVNRWKATRLGTTNKNAKYTLDGNNHKETKEETDLLATVAAIKSNRAGEYMDGGLGYKAKKITAPLIWPHQEFCNRCYTVCFIN